MNTRRKPPAASRARRPEVLAEFPPAWSERLRGGGAIPAAVTRPLVDPAIAETADTERTGSLPEALRNGPS